MDGAHVRDTTIQAKTTESSEQTSLITANNTQCTKSDTVRKRLLTRPKSVMQNGNQSIQCSSKAKKRKSSICKDDKYNVKAEDNSIEDDIEEEKEIFALLVSNIPFQWTSEQITEFIQDHEIDVYAIEYLDGGDPDFGQRLRLSFLSFEKCNEARKKLKLKMVKGRKLSVAFIVPEDSDSDSDSKTSLLIDKSECKPATTPSPLPLDVDVSAPDPEGVYGLRADYLESLGIRPPIDRWVHVSNFRCDKSELKEVLELAGQVVICNVIMTRERYAKVMYSHPLEAVQAVSMLNGRLLYGQVLKVSMYQCPDEVILPKGLSDVGPGLGEGGRPLRDIAKEYARHIMGGHSAVDRSIFVERGSGQSRTPIKGNSTRQPRPPSSESAPGYPNPSNVPITNSTGPYQSGQAPGAERFDPPVPNRPQTVVRFPGDVGYQSCPVPGLRGPGIINPGAVRHQTPPANPGMVANTWASYVAPNLNNRPVDRLAQQCKGPTASVELSNLPLSTTFPLLSEKMAQVGQVMSLELTRAGCALVRFANPAQAQRCYQHFNKMCAMGNTIEVRFV